MQWGTKDTCAACQQLQCCISLYFHRHVFIRNQTLPEKGWWGGENSKANECLTNQSDWSHLTQNGHHATSQVQTNARPNTQRNKSRRTRVQYATRKRNAIMEHHVRMGAQGRRWPTALGPPIRYARSKNLCLVTRNLGCPHLL